MILVYLGVGLLFILISIPLIHRRVPPNPLYGLRVPATFKDEWVWYEANAATARDLLRIGALQIVVAGGLAVAGVSEGAYALVNTVVMLIAVLWMTVVGWRRANHLLAQRQAAAKGDRRDGRAGAR
jgi:uncharacterized membrane protein